MGTIAARDCTRVLDLSEQVVAALLIAVRQAVWLRTRVSPLSSVPSATLERMLEALADDVPAIVEDRGLEPDLRRILDRLRARAWNLYA